MQGWVRLHRKLLQSAVFKSERPLKVWVWCLLRANHRRTRILWNGSEKDLLPGQFITGRFEGARECHMKPSTFWYQLGLLRRLRNLDIQSDSRNSLVTVVNWLQYQPAPEKSDSHIDNRLTASGQPVDTDKNLRMEEGKKGERAPLSFPTDEEEAKAFFREQSFLYPETEAAKFFTYYSRQGWDGDDWRSLAKLWNLRTLEYSKRNPQTLPVPGRPNSKPLDDGSWRVQTYRCVDCGEIHHVDERCPKSLEN